MWAEGHVGPGRPSPALMSFLALRPVTGHQEFLEEVDVDLFSLQGALWGKGPYRSRALQSPGDWSPGSALGQVPHHFRA